MRFNRKSFDPRQPSLSTVPSYDSRAANEDKIPLKMDRPTTPFRTVRTDSTASSKPSLHKQDTFGETSMDNYATTPPREYSPMPPKETYNPNGTHAGLPPPQFTAEPSSYVGYEMPQVRPQVLARGPSVHTKYIEMLLHMDKIPQLHNILASLFTWVLLAGFLVVPGTFTSFKNSETFKQASSQDSDVVEAQILHSVANIGLLWVSGGFCVIGSLGCLWLWFTWRSNYVWITNKIFLPALLNSIAGLLTTVVNVYTAQKGVWSVTAKITAIVTSSCVAVAGGLFCVYNFWILEKVRSMHEQEVDPEGFTRRKNNKKRESMMEKVKRKATQPGFAPGSVV